MTARAAKAAAARSIAEQLATAKEALNRAVHAALDGGLQSEKLRQLSASVDITRSAFEDRAKYYEDPSK